MIEQQKWNQILNATRETGDEIAKHIDKLVNGSATGQATKFDDGKPRWDLLPYDALNAVTRVMMHGAGKYGDRNWLQGGPWGRFYAATFRHLTAWFLGENNDPDSGESHIAHACCNILFLLTYILRGLGDDNRDKLK